MENLEQKYDKMCDEHLAQCQRCNDNIDAMSDMLKLGVTESQMANGLTDYALKNPGHNKLNCPDFPDFPEE